VVSYVWLGQALLALLPWNADAELRARNSEDPIYPSAWKPRGAALLR
jgi:hypothetical protein